jgi:hypothetical protein
MVLVTGRRVIARLAPQTSKQVIFVMGGFISFQFIFLVLWQMNLLSPLLIFEHELDRRGPQLRHSQLSNDLSEQSETIKISLTSMSLPQSIVRDKQTSDTEYSAELVRSCVQGYSDAVAKLDLGVCASLTLEEKDR